MAAQPASSSEPYLSPTLFSYLQPSFVLSPMPQLPDGDQGITSTDPNLFNNVRNDNPSAIGNNAQMLSNPMKLPNYPNNNQGSTTSNNLDTYNSNPYSDGGILADTNTGTSSDSPYSSSGGPPSILTPDPWGYKAVPMYPGVSPEVNGKDGQPQLQWSLNQGDPNFGITSYPLQPEMVQTDGFYMAPNMYPNHLPINVPRSSMTGDVLDIQGLTSPAEMLRMMEENRQIQQFLDQHQASPMQQPDQRQKLTQKPMPEGQMDDQQLEQLFSTIGQEQSIDPSMLGNLSSVGTDAQGIQQPSSDTSPPQLQIRSTGMNNSTLISEKTNLMVSPVASYGMGYPYSQINRGNSLGIQTGEPEEETKRGRDNTQHQTAEHTFDRRRSSDQTLVGSPTSMEDKALVSQDSKEGIFKMDEVPPPKKPGTRKYTRRVVPLPKAKRKASTEDDDDPDGSDSSSNGLGGKKNKAKRKEMNRVAARRHREKSKEKLKGLEERKAYLENKVKEYEATMKKDNETMVRLQKENEMLRQVNFNQAMQIDLKPQNMEEMET